MLPPSLPPRLRPRPPRLPFQLARTAGGRMGGDREGGCSPLNVQVAAAALRLRRRRPPLASLGLSLRRALASIWPHLPPCFPRRNPRQADPLAASGGMGAQERLSHSTQPRPAAKRHTGLLVSMAASALLLMALAGMARWGSGQRSAAPPPCCRASGKPTGQERHAHRCTGATAAQRPVSICHPLQAAGVSRAAGDGHARAACAQAARACAAAAVRCSRSRYRD